jgi:hypothetical protein
MHKASFSPSPCASVVQQLDVLANLPLPFLNANGVLDHFYNGTVELTYSHACQLCIQ